MTDTAEPLRVEIRRVIHAPCETVFGAWISPETLARFMLPMEDGSARATIEPRLGGRFHIDMIAKGGKVYPHSGEYLEFDPPRRLRFTWVSLACPAELGSTVTVEFHAKGQDTELVLVHERFTSRAEQEDHRKGWTQILGLLVTAAKAGLAAATLAYGAIETRKLDRTR